MQKGLLRFGDDLEYPVQLLGTHAFEPRTWLWVWANTQSNLPPQLTEAALRIRQLGEAQTVEAFTQPSLQLDDITDHMIAMTCSGLEEAAAITARLTTAAHCSCCSTTCRPRCWRRCRCPA